MEKDDFIIKTEETDYEPNENGLGHELFHCMVKNRTKIAQYVEETEEIDFYDSLLQRCIRTAITLLTKGITQDDIITICSENHINTCVPFIATQFIGAKVASLDVCLSSAEISHLLKQVNPKIIFVSEKSVNLIEEALYETKINTELVVFGVSNKYSQFTEYLKEQKDESSFKPSPIKTNKQTAVIFFSSGTTGLPKGICISHYSRMKQVVNEIKLWNSGDVCDLSNYYFKPQVVSDGCLLNYAGLYWISSVGLLVRAVFTGQARMVCGQFDENKFWYILGKYKVSSLFITPVNLNKLRMNKRPSVDLSNLKVVLTGSCPISETMMVTLKDYFPNSVILQGYGQTESSGILSSIDVSNRIEVLEQLKHPLTCGKPVPGVWYKVVDLDTEQILGPNQKGELRYKTKYAMNGYHNLDSSIAYDKDGWLKSGDIVIYDENQYFYIVDRVKEMLKYQGWHVPPAYLEGILESHPLIKEAVVIGIPHEHDGDHPMALITLFNKDSSLSKHDIETFLEGKISDKQKLRGGIKFVDDIPRTSVGKIKRLQIKQMVLNNEI
ncbi:luciferin 4-monooxygenase-like [Aethina tumida]|uniref:luciferin 4-monooxygenase-like n=1 Tax=Aethina tumida TaxID=116153 RepID=UPI002147B78E|nr:luciferin 4-monooxygenase-like [Aethina tumida]